VWLRLDSRTFSLESGIADGLQDAFRADEVVVLDTGLSLFQ